MRGRMRTATTTHATAAAAICLLLLGAGPSAAKVCTDPARRLGVSRVIEIDTTGGPKFGQQQYKDHQLLQDGEVILTFDDGPLRAHTQAVVDALEAQCTKGTFFMVGSQAVADPDMVRQIARKGHTIGTHTWTHANLRRLNPVAARREIELAFSAVQQAAGQPIAPFFRFPFLADSRAMLDYLPTRDIATFSIEADSYDYKSRDAREVHKAILDQLAYAKKGIVLFHDIQPATAEALPGLLVALKARGFRVVHIRPKSAVATLAEFDGSAAKALAAKRAIVARDPMAGKAVTWPMASPRIDGGTTAQPAKQPASVQGPPIVAASPAIPAQPAQPPPQSDAPLPWAKPQRPEADWREKVFDR